MAQADLGDRRAFPSDLALKSILRDGTMTDAEIESFIDRLGNEKKRSIDEVRDFSFVRQAWKELEAGK